MMSNATKRNKTTSLIIGTIAVTLLLFGGYLALSRTNNPEFPPYYQELATQCNSNQCCTNSVKQMLAGQYRLEPKKGCKLGYRAVDLDCEGSYRWCEPPSSR